ncbi:MAG: DNA-formamidopyrimidine glycosylase family protein [bacterium]|nr:DNA-formamidopyrimidine glycosylase family protein [bacterium]
MPELPEVETIVRGLQKQIVGKKIVGVKVILPRIVRGNAGDFITSVSETTIQKVWRRGKMLVVNLSTQRSILIHLKLTGQNGGQNNDHFNY